MPPQQPQEQQVPQSPAGNSDPNFNFIFNDNQKAKKRFSLPGGSNLTKIVFLVVGGGAILGVLIIILSSVFGPKGIDKKQAADILARAEEITRVSKQVTADSRDVNTVNLASTTFHTLNSEQTQILSIVKKSRIKNSD